MKKSLYPILLTSLLFGCTTKEVQIVTEPGYNIAVTGTPKEDVTRTNGGASVKLSSSSKNVEVEVSGADRETVKKSLIPENLKDGQKIEIELPLLRDVRKFVVSSNPPEATVKVDGKIKGVTPTQIEVEFTRANSRMAWPERELAFSLDDWETISRTVNRRSPISLPEVSLERLVHPIPISLNAETEKSEPLEADISVNGEPVGKTPLIHTFTFKRESSSDKWSQFEVTAVIKDQYKPKIFTIQYGDPERQTIILKPVSELPVQRAIPTVKMTPTGAQLLWDESVHPGSLETGEDLSTVRELRALTDFDRRNPKKPCVNSFVVTPDSQQLIFGVTLTGSNGRFSNLWQSSAQMLSTGRRQITEGHYLDMDPAMGSSSDAETVVFQSNRGFRDSIDISSIRIVDKRVLGGIRQLTREQRFNYSPVYTNEDWELFFVSLEERFPLAKPQISFMGLDGALPTYLSENGEELALSPGGDRVYFNRIEPSTGFQQIYSIPKEGRPLTQVITRSAFMSANCFSPNVSPSGKNLLFVSDIDRDKNNRKNNNIYLLNIESGDITPVTQNLSDDISPVWSPTEPNVLFFISNRGGCYNIWRMELSRLE